MDCLDKLAQQGWFISVEGFTELSENGAITDIRAIIRKLLDADIRGLGSPVLSTEVTTKIKITQVVVQVQKVRNISAPKVNEESHVAPRMLKLTVTDGHFSCQAIEVEHISSISLDKTFPGTKILLKGCDVVSGSILLKPDNCFVLGGKVVALVEKWELNKSLPKHNRGSGRGGVDGPPAWVNFGRKIESSTVGANAGQPFKSLQVKEKDGKKENEEFEVQRQDAIAEAATGAVKKVFGGGVKQSVQSNQYSQSQNQTNNSNSYNQNNPPPPRGPKQPRNKREPRDKQEIQDKAQKPADKISLFAFLEDKLPVSEKAEVNGYTDNNYYSARKNPTVNFNYTNRRPNVSMAPSYSSTGGSTSSMNVPGGSGNFQERPPRFQRNEPSHSYFSDSMKFDFTASRNSVTNSVANSFDRMSLNDSTSGSGGEGGNFARNTLRQQLNYKDSRGRSSNFSNKNQYSQSQAGKDDQSGNSYVWNVGDRCMAKYWEDQKYYNAIVTAITARTCVVQFLDYGNYEEVLKTDCIPITEELQPEKPTKRSNHYQNNQFTGNMEFRQNKSRTYVRHN